MKFSLHPARFRVRVMVLVMALVILTPAVSGWTMSEWKVTPAGSEMPPGTEVAASCKLHFDSWMTGSTFDNDNSLIMYTDLSNPRWTVTRVEPMENQPAIVEQIPVRQGMQVRLDGWSLSYSSKQFDVEVKLTGTTPALNQSASILLMKLQENGPDAQPVKSSVVRKEVMVVVPTVVPTQPPVTEVTVNLTPAEYIEITPEPTPVQPPAPARRATYTPGPEAILICAALAGLVLVSGAAGRRQ
ncbi:MAG: hypothetical protein GYA23_07420 [Methanomicrobiales archaeon]|nr:hypothetical protein [Methanomicrobiales archaeon]